LLNLFFGNRLFVFFVLFQQYKVLFEGSGTNTGDKTIEDKFFEYEVRFEMREKGLRIFIR
jgi:hypothetical protein